MCLPGPGKTSMWNLKKKAKAEHKTVLLTIKWRMLHNISWMTNLDNEDKLWTYFGPLALTCPSRHFCLQVEQFGIWWTIAILSFFLQIIRVWMTSIHTLTWHVWFGCYERKAAWRLWENWWRISTRHYQILDATWPIWPLLGEASSTSKFGNKLWKLGEIQRDNLAERNDKGPGGITTWIMARDWNPPITAWNKRMRHARTSSFYSNRLLTGSIHRLLDFVSLYLIHIFQLSAYLYFIASVCWIKRSLIDCFLLDRLCFSMVSFEKVYTSSAWCLTTVTKPLDNQPFQAGNVVLIFLLAAI